MQDLFTAEDRDRLNAAMATGSEARYAELRAADPSPGTGLRIGLAIGYGLFGFIVGLVIGAFVDAPSGIVAVALGLVGLGGSQLSAGALHRRGQRSRAQQEIAGGYITERGWRMVERIALDGATPLLRRGDERETGWGIEGVLDDGTAFCVGHYQYTEVRTVTSTDADGSTSSRTEHTNYPHAVVLLPCPDSEYSALALSRGSWGLGSRIQGAFSNVRRVELESSEFNDAFTLMVADEVADLIVRARFTPAVQVAFIERGHNDAMVELEADSLMVARAGAPGHDDIGNLIDLLGDALWVRDLLLHDPPGRLPDLVPLRRLLLGDETHPEHAQRS